MSYNFGWRSVMLKVKNENNNYAVTAAELSLSKTAKTPSYIS